LFDLDVEPYLIRSGLVGVLSQRLVRRLCECSVAISADEERLGLSVPQARKPAGCDNCGRTGYSGRLLLAEFLDPSRAVLSRAVLARSDAGELQRLAVAEGLQTCFSRALQSVAGGSTSPAEVRRVFGPSVN
jgi:type II secretory ATPase GspE/PulE/Tfp pilus assembly ATPase PilB-like protein